MKRTLIILAMFSLLLPSTVLAEDFIGGLRNVKGDGLIIRGTEEIPAVNGLRIHLNDVLITQDGGSMGVVFKDDTRISLGPSSKISITEFIYSPAQNKYGFITKMLKGTASYVSGAIGKSSPEAVKFQTPVATIGIRGTTFLAKVEP